MPKKRESLDQLKERIGKLQRLASRAGTQAEAEAAAGKISALLLRHNLTAADVAGWDAESSLTETDAVAETRYAEWEVKLAGDVAWGHLCFALTDMDDIAHTAHVIRFIGRPENVAVTAEVFAWLRGIIFERGNQELAFAKEENFAAFIDPARWVHSYRMGFAEGIKTALARVREEEKQAHQEQWGLVLHQEADLERHLAEHYPDLQRFHTNRLIDQMAFDAGYSEGVDTPTDKQLRTEGRKHASLTG